MTNLELSMPLFTVINIHSSAMYMYLHLLRIKHPIVSLSLSPPPSLPPSPSFHRYSFMEGRGCSVQSFRVSSIGRMVTHCVLTVLETLSIAPKGVTKVHSVLQVAASSLIKSGRMEIFTPMFRVVGRKPDQE